MKTEEMILKEKMNSFYPQSAAFEMRTFFAPGRVNLIGEHIDYNGGSVFPAGLTLGITGLIRENGTKKIRMRSLNFEGEVLVDLNKEVVYDPKDAWGNYPKGVIRLLQDQGVVIPGCDIIYHSNLPDGSGLSSSAAIETLTTFMFLNITGNEPVDRIWLAKFCQKVENQFIKVNCGIMDQFSVAMGKEGFAMLLNCKTMEHKYVALNLDSYSLLIINTNKKRELSDSKYNERRRECEEALSLINKYEKIDSLCEADISFPEKYISDPILKKRARHVITENKRVFDSISFLEKGDLKSFGKLLNESHHSLKHDYEVTGKELDAIVEAANSFEECIGSRMTGAGFGGCAIALVRTKSIDAFKEKVGYEYRKKTGFTATFYVSKIGHGVREFFSKGIYS
jgi:galactokinase